MVEVDAQQVAKALKQCGSTNDCTGCPYDRLPAGQCMRKMQRDAAKTINGLLADNEAKTLAIREYYAT